MINYTIPIIILILDVVINFKLSYLIYKYRHSDLSIVAKRKGHHRAVLLLIANTFAMLAAFYGYFIMHLVANDALLLVRFADRYVMLFAYKDLEIE